MNPQTTNLPSAVLAAEIAHLERELQTLQGQRAELSKTPAFPLDAAAGQVAEKLVETVSANAPKLRAVEQAIAILEPKLQAQKYQLPKLRQQEEKVAAQDRVDAALIQMRKHCEVINSASSLIEREIQELKRIAAETGADRWTVYPYQRSYEFLTLPVDLTVPAASAASWGCILEPRPVTP